MKKIIVHIRYISNDAVDSFCMISKVKRSKKLQFNDKTKQEKPVKGITTVSGLVEPSDATARATIKSK